MENRPHGREKDVGSGYVNVNKGSSVNSGGPVGGGPRRPSSGGSRPSGTGFRPGTGSGRGYSNGSGQTTRSSRVKRSGGLSIPVLLLLAFLFFNRSGFDDSSVQSTQTYTPQSTYSVIAPAQTTPPVSTGSSGSNSGSSGSSSSTQTGSSSTAGVDLSVSSKARDKRYSAVGGGKDTVTVMVYMCGTDLESKSAMATKDLNEMLNANISSKVNLVVLTGGCKQWRNNVISSSVNQIYQVVNGQLKCVEKDFGTSSMTDPDNLASFIRYCKKNFPADRNELILWDHGGGSISAYGYDEKHSGSSMTLDKLNKALKSGNCTFDFIGFDACLMATLETALVCNNYADYLIASEETEPGTGWYYTGWLNALSRNTSVSTTELAKTLIDDYYSSASRSQITLSLIDLAELQGTVPDAFSSFAKSTTQLVADKYQQVSNARSGARQFAASTRINQVDLIDLADRLGTKDSQKLAKALRACVKYNRTNISNAYGISIYFPYENKSTMNSAVSVYNSIGFDSEYTACIKSFASTSAAAQTVSSPYTSGSYGSYSGSYGTSSSGSYGSSYGSSISLSDLFEAYLGDYSSSGSSYGGGSPIGSLTGGYSNPYSSSSGSLDLGSIIDLLSSFSGRSMPEELSWVDTDFVAKQAQSIASGLIDPSHITISNVNGKRALSLTEEEWSLIQSAELNVYVDDGSGYIDLGLDNTLEFLDNGDMSLEFDGTWLTLNGNVCCYYMVSDTQDSDGSWTTIGMIPVLLNGSPARLQVVFDSSNPTGYISGAWANYSGETDTSAKGDIEIVEGDEIQLLCDYYSYDGTYEESCMLGNSFTVGASGLTLKNLRLADVSCSVCYKLTDIYGICYWTPAISYTAG